MKVSINEATQKVTEYLLATGLGEDDTRTLTDLIIEQQIIGNQFSAIGELAGKHQRLVSAVAQAGAEIVMQKPSAMLIKGNGRAAPLITADNLSMVVKAAKRQGIFALGIYDASYNDFFDVFCRRVAAQDCIALIFENGGPQGVLPYGALKDDITGTNPLAYGIPTNTDPIIFDAATAEHAYGRIRVAKERGEQLPNNAYVDKDGSITTSPHDAYAILPFGGYKGWAINLLVDVLSGALVQAKSGLDLPLDDPDRHIGTFMIVIDPACFGEIIDFKKAVSKLVSDITAVQPRDPKKPVRTPGTKGSERLRQAKLSNMIEIDQYDWEKFLTAYRKGVTK